MATGIEIAGLVLGSLPVVIAGLKFYAEGIATSKRLRRYRQEFEDLRVALDAENARFDNNLRWILQGIIKEQDVSVLKTINELFKDPEIKEQLKARLGSSYSAYMGTVDKIEATACEFLKRLRLDSNGKAPFDDPNAFKRQYKKLEFSLSKSEYDDLLTRLDKGNQMLRDLTFQIQTLDTFQKTSSFVRRPLSDFKLIHESAVKFHDALKTSWKCFCPTDHHVHLRLEPRLKAKKNYLNDTGNRIDPDQSALGFFYVVFRHSNRSSESKGKSKAPAWTWEEADITLANEDAEESSGVAVSGTSRSVSGTSRSVSGTSRSVSGTSRSIKFSEPIAERLKDDKDTTPHQNARDIQSLCLAISNLQHLQRDVCLLLGTAGRPKQDGVLMYPRKEPSTNRDTWSTLSLADILDDKNFKKDNRLKLAVTLASSVLQLYETPWLQTSWTNSHILFIKCREHTMYQSPFVVHRDEDVGKQALLDDTSNSLLARIIRNKTLFALGVTLIELWYGQPLQQLHVQEDGPEKAQNALEASLITWNTADRLAVELEHEAGIRYSLAVRRCIRCDFNESSSNLQDVCFQRTVYDKIVALLKETVDILYAL